MTHPGLPQGRQAAVDVDSHSVGCGAGCACVALTRLFRSTAAASQAAAMPGWQLAEPQRLGMAAMAYGLPLIGVVAGALAGHWASGGSDPGSVGGAALGLGIALRILRRCSARMASTGPDRADDSAASLGPVRGKSRG